MPSVGPELPPHLAKRKRSIDEHEHRNSPPRKVQAATAPSRVLGPTLPPSKNPDELNVDSDSEDDLGPAAQPTKGPSPPPKRVAGPSLPPSKNSEELNLEDDSSEDDYGPTPQPLKPTTTARPKQHSPPPKKRVLGPAPPPASLSEMPSHPANDPDSSSDDDDFGPSLPPAPGSAAEAALISSQRAERERESAALNEPSKPQRAEWMLVPPSDSSWTSRIDPTKLKSRKFASGKGSKAPAEKSGISAIWTETPDEKRQRLADEVLGRKDLSTASTSSRDNRGKEESKEEKETARRIKEYNDKNRSKSLYEEREARGGEKKEEDDDPSKRGFDREKDMALGGQIGGMQKREMLAKARDFGSRFQKGKYL